MRLIDADALMKKLGITNMDCNECQWGTRHGNSCCYCSRGGNFEDACIAIENAPTIEQPQTGKWMFSPDDAEGICTVCQYKIYGRPYQGRYLIVPYNFCPNCGARMVTE